MAAEQVTKIKLISCEIENLELKIDLRKAVIKYLKKCVRNFKPIAKTPIGASLIKRKKYKIKLETEILENDASLRTILIELLHIYEEKEDPGIIPEAQLLNCINFFISPSVSSLTEDFSMD